MSKSPRCIIIGGPNGAGKTTFAREFLSKEAGVIHFVNPDLIASGLSPLRPELAALAAGRLFLRQLDLMAKSKHEELCPGCAYDRCRLGDPWEIKPSPFADYRRKRGWR